MVVPNSVQHQVRFGGSKSKIKSNVVVLQHAVQISRGLRLRMSKAKRARSVYCGLQEKGMTERRQAIPSFLHALILKNLNVQFTHELSDENFFECFYIKS